MIRKFCAVAAAGSTVSGPSGVVKVMPSFSRAEISLTVERYSPPHTSSAYSTYAPAGMVSVAAEPFLV